uniref:[histone H3]-lysine(36) N-trimethyltransferase n=1 Tax=Poecilia formosa TaxID=48698 RepID=A0A087X778_POEFO
KVEGLSTSALIKSLSPRVMLSNHLLPKGTKMRVNLEDQGRQKVSFSFSQTKKPLQSSFFISANPDTTVTEPHNASSQSILDKVGKNAESKTEQKQTALAPSSTPEKRPQTSASPSTRLQKNLGKMHFKKQIISVSVTEESPKAVTSEEVHVSESEVNSQSDTEAPAPPPENVINDVSPKNVTTESSETKEDSNLKKSASLSGKDGDSSSCTDRDSHVYKRKTRSQSDSAPPCSESDGDLTHASSSRKSEDSKSKTSSDSRVKEAKRSSSNSHAGEKEKNSSKRTETQERSSSYSKSDRDSRMPSSRSSRLDKDRRRSRTRSRSRSRGSRTSSSHSRSERSSYHESDRRSHRSSPRREKRRSRSRTERTRYSSDSEDDHRKTRTRTSGSSRSSNYSSSHKASQSSSYSRSEKSSKSLESPHSSETDKRTQSSKSERTSKRSSDSDSQHRCSPDLDPSSRKSSSHHRSDTSTKSSSSSTHSKPQSHDKNRKNSSGDSEGEHKTKPQSSEVNTSLLENSKDSQEKTSRPDSKHVTPSRSSIKSPRHHRQSDDMFHSPAKAPSCETTAECSPQMEREKSDSEPGEDAQGGQGDAEMVLSTEKTLQECLGKTEQVKPVLELEPENASATTSIENLKLVDVTLENVCNVKAGESELSLTPAVLNSCESEDSVIVEKDGKVPKPSLDATETNITDEIQQNTNMEIVEPNDVLAAENQYDPQKSDLSCLQAESQLSEGQQSKDAAKKSTCTTRKSRWDIVGQDSCENDHSNRAVCAESNLSPEKVVSVKRIEFSNDGTQHDLDSKGSIQSRDAKHSNMEQDVSLVTFKHEDQSEPSQASTSIDRCDFSHTTHKPYTDEPSHTNNQLSQIHLATLGDIQSIDACESKLKESTHRNKSSKRTAINQDMLATPSDASDSDNSAYDSDCDNAIKQFHSVVVVPKHSSLTKRLEDGQASSCTPLRISGQPSTQTGDTNQVNAQQTQTTTTSFVESPHIGVLCQSQSNMIDSTSHSEGSNAIGGQLFGANHPGAQRSAMDSTPLLDHSRQCEQSLKQLEISSQGEQVHLQYQPNTLSDDINSKMSFSLGWDLSQPEQPTSTCQQPDSSHGPQLNTKATATDSKEPEQSIHSGTHQSSNMQTIKRPYLHTHEHYQEPSSEIHPDSLTNDHDDYRAEKSSSHNKALNTPGSASSVQGPEISSNSRGPALPEPPREDNHRPHRSRGPPKKRRPEIESDSDNEAEAGPSGKRERQEDVALSKEVKAEVDRPSLTLRNFQDSGRWKDLAKIKKMPPYFDLIEENKYLTERKKSKSHRDIKRMQCECPVLSREDRAKGVMACGEDCLNRLLMIECSSRCLNGAYCSNRRFQMKQHADFEVILTEDKGWGLRAARDLAPNTFVLEYCGEVLDHKGFKSRVKEYARNKNIHYYFMALKNNEIIDATLKGNCSRFMNHSCEPNCETQKWTVNGQLRVGFFTTTAVTAGTELTFDYQFQRYGKEAQKCFCGAPSCRGFLGGENRVSVRAAGGKMKKDRSRKNALTTVDEELEALLENGEGLYDEKQVVSLCRLMVRVETMEQKLLCLKLIQDTQNPSCLKQFLDHHGLSLLWIFMVELSEAKGNSANNNKLQLEIMKTLAVLPISTKNMLEESKVLTLIQRWAQIKTLPQQAEMDGYSSENTSRAQTPLNTPDGSSTKMAPDLDGDASKPAVYRRLKIISENSLDSALSDASKGSDGKEDEEEEEEDVPTEQPPETKETRKEPEDEEEASTEPQLGEPAAEAPPNSETPEAPVPAEGTAAQVEPSVIGTPSQDEEEGVSDVESERSQEPHLSVLDISGMAARLLESWKDLKEVYRIPKKTQVEKEKNFLADRSRDRDLALTPRAASGSRERDRTADKTPRNSERRRRRSPSPPPLPYERSSRRNEERFDTPSSKTQRGAGGKERNKLSTEERRKLFEQEVVQTLTYDPLVYASSPGFITYPPGYPIQTFVDPTNPNAGKVLLPTPAVDPGLSYEQTPASDLSLPSPSSTSQAAPVSNVSQHITTTSLTAANPQQYTQPAVAAQEGGGVAVLSVPAPQAPQAQGQQSYATLWDPATQQAVTVQTQPAQQYAAAPGPPQTQTAIYYQGQPCQTIYSIPTAYPQANAPVIQAYTEPTAGYLHGQPVYPGHQQGVVVQQGGTVTTIVTSQTVQQQEMIVPNNVIDLPPPSPPKPKTIVLPPNWKAARDPEGKIYYCHFASRQTQWDPPTWEGSSDNTSVDHESEMDLGTPTYDENPSKFSTKTAEADTSSELAKKSKETFRKEMSQFIVQCLNPYRKPDCKSGRISNTEDFKHLARKLTHGVMNKELKACKNPEDLECNENVKHKTKEYIKKYMQRFGSVYRPKEDTDVY